MDVWTKFEEGRTMHSWVIERKVLKRLTLVTLIFDLVTPIGFLCWLGWMCGGRYVKAFFSYWLETKRLQTDGPTDRHAQSNMPCPLFFEGGCIIIGSEKTAMWNYLRSLCKLSFPEEVVGLDFYNFTYLSASLELTCRNKTTPWLVYKYLFKVNME